MPNGETAAAPSLLRPTGTPAAMALPLRLSAERSRGVVVTFTELFGSMR